jgi:hypothetical protein
MQRPPRGHGRHLLGQSAPGPPGGICLNGRGNWKTAYDRFRRWTEDGTLESAAWHLQGELDAEGSVDWSQLGGPGETKVRA